MIQPIDDLIEHLKGQTPYGKTEALKLWEALKILSDGILTKGSIQASQLVPGSITFDSGALGGDISNLLTKYSNLWSTNIVFSATNNNTVQWTAGTIKFVDGTQATISAGNTGVMSALTYIIYHPDFSNTTFQISTNYGDAVGPADRILMCIANNVADATQNAFFVPSVGTFGINNTVIGPNSISTGSIQANAITTGLINAGAVTAAKINVAQLSAISADLGSITAGTITGGTIQTSSGTGARVVLDSTGIHAYNSSNVQVAQIKNDATNIFNVIAGTANNLYLAGTVNTFGNAAHVWLNIADDSNNFTFNVASIGIFVFQVNGSQVLKINTSGGIELNSGQGIKDTGNNSSFVVSTTTAQIYASGSIHITDFSSSGLNMVTGGISIGGTTVINSSAQHIGNGASLTSLNAGNISSGTLAIARGGTNNTGYATDGLLRYDGSVFTNSASFTYNGTDVTLTSGTIKFNSGQGIKDSGSNSSYVVTSTVAQVYANGGTQVGEFGTGNLKLYVNGGFRTVLTFNDGLGHNVLYY